MVCAIEEEAMEAIERLRQCCKEDLLIDQNFNIPIFNILWRIATNRRYSVSLIGKLRYIKHLHNYLF